MDGIASLAATHGERIGHEAAELAKAEGTPDVASDEQVGLAAETAVSNLYDRTEGATPLPDLPAPTPQPDSSSHSPQTTSASDLLQEGRDKAEAGVEVPGLEAAAAGSALLEDV